MITLNENELKYPYPSEFCIIRADGTKAYYVHTGSNIISHRSDGPAFEWANGDASYLKYGKCHRLDGPAIINKDGKYYYIEGKTINVSSDEELEKHVKKNRVK